MSRFEKLLVFVFLAAVFLTIAAATPLITASVQTVLAQIGLH